MNFNKISENLVGYAETKIELLKLEAKGGLARALSAILFYGLFSFLLLVAIIFFSVALSAKLNEVLDSDFLGYLIVATVYIIIFLSLILFLNKHEFYRSLAQKIIKLTSKDEHTE